MMKRYSLAVLLLLTAFAPEVLAKTQSPVAVMPFRNLNNDPELAWLSAGISETMISDIRKTSRLDVVERDQIEKALSELSFQNTKQVDATTAAAIGRIVGAKTIVVGGYQKAGKQLRITARFVSVETSIVQDTAKVTGSLQGVFALQDQIVGKLVKGHTKPRPPKKAVKPRPPANNKTVKAYKLYAMSLHTATDASRTQALQAALEIDPSFVYAIDDIERLEERLRKARERAIQLMSQEQKDLRKQLADASIPEYERSAAAGTLHANLITNGMYKLDLELAEQVYKIDWREPLVKKNMRPSALTWMVGSYEKLGRYDEALQVGEQFLDEFPTNVMKSVVDMQMQSIIKRKLDAKKAVQNADAEVAKLNAELDKVKANDRMTPEVRAFRIASLEMQRCTALSATPLRAISDCQAFIHKYRGNTDTNVKSWHNLVRFYHATAHKNAGRFNQARSLIDQLIKDEPDFAREMYLQMQVTSWPRE